jgi:hypothetical protein
MIYFFNPYSFEKKLFQAYDMYMDLIKSDDWACFTDGDTCFFENNFGHQVKSYIEKYPDTGLFTSYSSRCAYSYMVPKDTNQDSDSIRYHRQRSAEIYNRLDGQVKEIDNHIAGHLICIKKSTWQTIRQELLKVIDGANLLGVDTQISNEIRAHGLKIRLMRGIYLFHYYRLLEGRNSKIHLMDQTINVLIRTSNRENLFKRCIASVRNQTHKNVRILVSADDEKTAEYVKVNGLDPVNVKKGIRSETETMPYNVYLNNLIDQVKGGWILILDDDDYLANDSVLEKLSKCLVDDNVIYFIRMRWPNGRIIPSDQNFNCQQIIRRDIGMPCFIFHAKHKHKVAFRPVKQGDFDFATRLTTVVKRKSWINMIVTQIGNTGLNGKPE